ncbi:hypothetical protein RCH09_003370 [Actimicrobium sp. GrIS 1.19]|uniref:hypothetical protein n=1 Tax=Actimicrobium sp. GrIS 1.19 TaxID=3071708 RepID=UPI002E08E3FB|nr:hypothetical protein [Actimicrobium sp. GrIS 1.19]
MKNTIVLPTGQARISVGAALKEIVNVAKFPPAVSIFVEIFTDSDGNESSPDDAQVRCEQTDGRRLATHKVKATFLSFCESTGTKPRNPYAPWVFDYAAFRWTPSLHNSGFAGRRRAP